MIDKIDETSGMVELWFSVSQMLIREKEKNNVRINVSQTLEKKKNFIIFVLKIQRLLFEQ